MHILNNGSMINSNMRCIEIKNGIKTDDVLSDKQ